MKRYFAIAIVVLMTLCFAACYANNEVNSDVDNPLLSEGVTFSTASEAQTTTPTETQATTEETTVVTTAEGIISTTFTTSTAAITTTAQSKLSVPVSTAAKPTTTVRTTATTTRATITRKAVTTTAKPTTTAPPFDVEFWVQYAKDFALSIGMELDKSTKGTWDTPLSAGPTLIYTERDIKDRISRYQRQGYTAVWVWAEKRPNSDRYNLYISRG